LDAYLHSTSTKLACRDKSECAKSRDFRPILASLREPGLTPEWVAEAAGIEPQFLISAGGDGFEMHRPENRLASGELAKLDFRG
jgi:hypothetical protein